MLINLSKFKEKFTETLMAVLPILAIVFDSGGVTSEPMTATFLLPFAMGACEALSANIITDAFGIVSMVAMTVKQNIENLILPIFLPLLLGLPLHKF